MATQNPIVWTKLYADSQIADWKIPAATAQKPEEGVFRHLYLKWSALPQQTSAGAPLDLYNICTDVLVLDKPATFTQGALLFCRRLEVAQGASITLDRTTDALPFLLVVQEIVDETGQKIPLKITTTGTDGSKDWSLDLEGKKVAMIQWEMDAAAPVYPTTIDPAYLLEGEPLRLHLRTIFQVATLLSTELPKLCIKQLYWVAAIGEASPITRPMSGQAFSFAVSIQESLSAAQNDHALLIPSLDPTLYAEQASAFNQLLHQRQSKWEALQLAADNAQNWIAAAKDALDVGQIQNNLDVQLWQKAVETTDQALASRRLVSKQLVALSLSVYQKNELFKADVNRWGREESVRRTFDLIKSVFEIASSLPGVIALGPEIAIGPVIAGVGQAVQLGKSALDQVVDAVNPSSPQVQSNPAVAARATGGVATRANFGRGIGGEPIGGEGGGGIGGGVITGGGGGEEGGSGDEGGNNNNNNNNNNNDNNVIVIAGGGEANPPLEGASDYIGPGNKDKDEELREDGPPVPLPKPSWGDEEDGGGLEPVLPDPEVLKQEKENREKRMAAAEKLIGSIKKLGGDVENLKNAVVGLVDIGEKVEAYRKAGDKALNAAANTANQALSSYNLEGLDILTGGKDHWETLSIEMNNLFKNIPEKISAAEPYKLELDKLIYMGRTYSHAQLALAKAKIKEAEMQLRLQGSMQSVGIFKNRIKKLGDKVFRDEGIQQLVFSKILEAKRTTYLAMEEYRRAFIYYTLSNRLDQMDLPKITADSDDFSKMVATISGNALAKSSLTGQVSDYTGAKIVLNDPELLKTFIQNDGALQWECSTNASVFNSFGRIRMTEMRVYLDGLSYQGLVEVKIVSSGIYIDKPTGPMSVMPRFSGPAMRFNFVYDAGNNNKIQSAANISSRLVDYFFNPTPFTTWTIKAMAQDGTPLDFSTVTGIHFEFFGQHTSL